MWTLFSRPQAALLQRKRLESSVLIEKYPKLLFFPRCFTFVWSRTRGSPISIPSQLAPQWSPFPLGVEWTSWTSQQRPCPRRILFIYCWQQTRDLVSYPAPLEESHWEWFFGEEGSKIQIQIQGGGNFSFLRNPRSLTHSRGVVYERRRLKAHANSFYSMIYPEAFSLYLFLTSINERKGTYKIDGLCDYKGVVARIFYTNGTPCRKYRFEGNENTKITLQDLNFLSSWVRVQYTH